MRDWKPFVQERMGVISLAPDQREDIVTEIAAHFEDICEAARSEGLTEADALERAKTEEVDWRQLAAQIQRTKQQEESMNERTKRLWVRGFAALTAATMILAILQGLGRPRVMWLKLDDLACMLYVPWILALPFFGMNERTKRFLMPGFINLACASIFMITMDRLGYAPSVILTRSSLAVMAYPAWLIGQPLFGALGAYFSRRGGGTLRERVGAALVPSVVVTAMFAVLLIRAFASDPHDLGPTNLSMLAKGILSAVLIPSAGLLAGALPFLRESKAPELARN